MRMNNQTFPVHYCDLPCLFHVVNLLGQYKYVCNTMYVSRGYIALLGYIKQAQEIISTACSSALKKELGRFLQAPKQHRPKYILLLLPFNTAITLEMMAQIAKCVLDQSYCCSNIIALTPQIVRTSSSFSNLPEIKKKLARKMPN